MSAGRVQRAAPLRLVANEYLAAGLCVVPATAKKHPVVSDDPKHNKWERYQADLPHADEVDDWFSNPKRKPHGLGFVCGRVSGGVEVADLDAKHDPSGTLNARAEAAIREAAPGLWERLVIEQTPSGGLHLYYRCANPDRNLKLARMPNAEGKLMAVAETRGEGGFIMAAPSPGYQVVQGSLTSLPFLTDGERAALFAALRSLDRSPPAPETPAVNTRARTDFPRTDNLPGDAYNASEAWADMMKEIGWTTHDGKHWTRPGKSLAEGNSANWDTMENLPRHFHCYTANAYPLEEGETYSPFKLYAVLKCGGDYKLAARELEERGFGVLPKPRASDPGKEGQARLDAEHEASHTARHEGGANGGAPAVPAVTARPLMALTATADERSRANLLGNGFLRVGQGALFVGATGIGKSSFLMQAAICWALGEAHFCIRPSRPLTILIIQAENDDIDLVEMRDGVLKGFNLSPAQLEAVRLRVHVMTEHARGLDLFPRIGPEVQRLGVDLLIIDPAFAYVVGGVKDQEAVTFFLRGLLQPFIVKHNVGVIVAHHVNKPPSGREKPTWQAGDFAYAGSGSAEFGNWARGVLYLRSVGSHDVFELRGAKRGKRLGLCDERGNPVERLSVRHARAGGIFWELANAADVQRAAPDPDTVALFKAFHQMGHDAAGGVSIDKLARKVGESARNLNRRFENADRIAVNDEALIRRKGSIFLEEIG